MRELVSRLMESYAADIIHMVTRENAIAAKHFLLPLGLHSLTGQKKAIGIVNKLKHCISYP